METWNLVVYVYFFERYLTHRTTTAFFPEFETCDAQRQVPEKFRRVHFSTVFATQAFWTDLQKMFLIHKSNNGDNKCTIFIISNT